MEKKMSKTKDTENSPKHREMGTRGMMPGKQYTESMLEIKTPGKSAENKYTVNNVKRLLHQSLVRLVFM